MRKRLFRRTGLHWVKQSASFSLLTIILVSTFLSFTADIKSPQVARAAEGGDLTIQENQDIRVLRYFKDCLTNYLNTDDGDGFTGWSQVFETGERQIIAVGPDLDTQNGMWTCGGVSKRAVAIYTDTGDEEAYLMKALWGKTYAGNNGNRVTVSTTTIKRNASKIIENVNAAIVRREGAGSSRRATLKRFSPLLVQCFQNWSDKNFAEEPADPNEAIEYRNRKIFAERKEFDWDKIDSVNIRSVKSNGTGPARGSNGFIGDVELNFKTKTGIGAHGPFADRSSDWYPIGNDLGESVVGSSNYKKHSGQSFLDCNWIKANNEFLFGQSNKYFFAVKDGKPWVSTKNASGGVEFVEEVATDATPGGTGSNEYQCIVAPPLSWIACPVITLVVNGIEVLEGAIIEAVQVPPLTADGPFEGLHTTWAGFRDLANALLVLVFLVAIFAQVLPLEVDPYMVKKVLPKLIAAAIFIQFSYFFVQIMFDISRVLGQGITTLIDSVPVGDIGGGLFGQDAGNTTATSTMGLLGTVAIGGAAGAAAFTAGTALVVPILLLLFAGLLSVVTLFVTLQIRMIVIIIFTIISPLAFLAWILPNTENYFKKWLVGLIKLLLMYPIIVFMVQSVNLISNISYQALAAMAGSNTGGAGGVSDISKIMVSIIPIIVYFMIPMTFKWAGGIFASVSGAIQDQGKKLSRRARTGATMKNSLGDIRNRAALKLPDPGKGQLGMKDVFGRKGFRRLGARTASGNALSFGKSGAKKIDAAKRGAVDAERSGVQAIHRGKSNDTLLQILKELKKNGKMGEATAVADLIAKQGGGLELSKYFESLEFDGQGNRLADADTRVKRGRNGSVKEIHDEIWNSLQKDHGSTLASEVPSSIGKPMSSASPNAFISAKGRAPAIEFQREVAQLEADLSSTEVNEEGKRYSDIAQEKLNELAETFTQTAQRDNAGDMQGDMVGAWKNVAKVLGRTTNVEMKTAGGNVPIEDFINKQTENGKLHKYVQGT